MTVFDGSPSSHETDDSVGAKKQPDSQTCLHHETGALREVLDELPLTIFPDRSVGLHVPLYDNPRRFRSGEHEQDEPDQ